MNRRITPKGAGRAEAAEESGRADHAGRADPSESAQPASPADDSAWNPIPTRTLVHALVRTDGTVDAGELYTVAGLLSMTDQQVRLCVKRLVAEGRFTHEGRGRKAVLRAVADPTGAIAPDAAHVGHAYRQDHGLAPWDGRWHLFAFAVPESARAARDALRDTLLHLGAAPLQGGLYAAANPIAPLVEAQAHHLGVPGQVTYLTSTDLRVGEVAEPRALAAALWPLDEIAARHDRLAAFARNCLGRLENPDEAERRAGSPTAPERLTLAVQLAAAFTYAMGPDPLLPPELLPAPWPGAGARQLFATAWTALTNPPGPDSGRSLPRLFALYEDLTASA
ncbi:PaaX family transcriptional regulator C-terminal domain-containing protein [Streptomyces sp. NBC_00233]|uniref:PaaX family transcriptional regulator C-terminal domain-containing protein n=1 Tax=Streptomyces sp. NBC_00233 TaxID=2975686 RepID=UPI002256D30E|nr:PaaX family transcriptional regulator C-terminal domain-containing protein [Streptomyces sp. NBC_00233]MCX5232151.1 transcriptional regulator [Streptomyces sp. NBC_00233]